MFHTYMYSLAMKKQHLIREIRKSIYSNIYEIVSIGNGIELYNDRALRFF